MKLRDYQHNAVAAAERDLAEFGKALIVAGTGAGKSLCIASFCKRLLEWNPHARVLSLCYVKEILESNAVACSQLAVESGIYCAGSGRRDTEHRVIHASRASLARDPLVCGAFDTVIIDEAHMLSSDKESQYQKIIAALNPRHILGLTATPFRLDGGYIYGKRRFFPRISYNISHASLVQQGYLVPYSVADAGKALVDVSGLKIVRGDYRPCDLDPVLENVELCEKAMHTWHAHARDRKTTLFFCHSVAHATLCAKVFAGMFPQFEHGYLDGKTKAKERKAMIANAQRGKLKAIFSVTTLTTGTNIPPIDCVFWLRPTASPILWVQGNGRASRLFACKENALVIDVVGNLGTFESVDAPLIINRGSTVKMKFTNAELIEMGIDPAQMKGEAPTKICKNLECKTVLHAAAKTCDECKVLQVVMKGIPEIGETACYLVESVSSAYTKSKAGRPMFVVTYVTEGGNFTEYILHAEVWAQQVYFKRQAQIRENRISHLEVAANPKNEKFPKLNPIFKESLLLGSKQMGSFAGDKTQRVSIHKTPATFASSQALEQSKVWRTF